MSLETVSKIFGGQMSEGEMDFCRHLRNRLQDVLEKRHDFHSTVVDLFFDLQKIRGTHRDFRQIDVDTALASGWHPAVAQRSPDFGGGPPLSEAQITFVSDMDGLLDYAMRNGINFLPVFGIISHDIYEVRENAFTLDGARFTPQVSGWASRNQDVFGQSEE